MVTTNGGTGADVGHGKILLAFGDGGTGIHTEFGAEHTLRQGQIGGGDTDGAAQLAALYHHAAENVGVTQETGGLLHAALQQQLTDMGGGNADAVAALGRYYCPGQVVFFTVVAQKLGVALAPEAETEIIAADKAGSAVFILQHLQEIPPGHRPQRRIKGQLHDLRHAVTA